MKSAGATLENRKLDFKERPPEGGFFVSSGGFFKKFNYLLDFALHLVIYSISKTVVNPILKIEIQKLLHMENSVSFNALETIEKIYKKSEDSQLRISHFDEASEDLKNLSGYLGVDEITAVIFANAFAQSHDSDSFVRVFRHFGDNEFMLFLKHQESVDRLFRKKLLAKKVSRRSQPNSFQLPQSVVKKISRNEEICTYAAAEPHEKNLVDVLEEFNGLSDEYDGGRLETYELDQELHTILSNNAHLTFFRKIEDWKLNYFEIFFLLDCVWDAISNGNNNYNTGVSLTVDDYWKSKSLSIKYAKLLTDGKTQLNMLNLIEIKNDRYRDRATAKLSKNMVKILKENENIELEYGEDANARLINHRNIRPKDLFYNDGERSHIETLKNLLEDERFRRMQEKLAEKAMPAGLTILLHGEPGTGKTESVYQLARETGRNIFKVDISETKTMWFGESEKLVKKIFTDYAEMRKEEKKCPILLFNEADAVINKRKTGGRGNTDNTENAIQNILLEELENFDGILVATTNLVENMDAAFERRFLFKIKFEKPEPENSAKIWRSKLPYLSEKECRSLAAEFDFSGGEMENIARKTVLEELVHGEKPGYAKVLDLCRAEKWHEKERKKIGF